MKSLAAIFRLTASTRTPAGVRVRSELDEGAYPQEQEVSDDQMVELNLERHRFHGDWNYTIHPKGRLG